MAAVPEKPFRSRLAEADASALVAERIGTLLVNVGLRCDQECDHCHVEASPSRTETMSAQTMDGVVRFAGALRPDLVDVTGGAPELHPEIESFLAALREKGLAVRMRTNLTALAASDGLARRLAELGVDLLASVPLPDATQDPRDATWGSCAAMLEHLAGEGYGDGAPALDLAATCPTPLECAEVAEIEQSLRDRLAPHGVVFRRLALITCVPVGRFAESLGPAGMDACMRTLELAFESSTLPHLGCRHGIEVAWDGSLWDCDFNLAAGVRPPRDFRHIEEAVPDRLASRPISFGNHCYACTAAAGSS